MGRGCSSRPLSSLTWFSFLFLFYSNLLPDGLVQLLSCVDGQKGEVTLCQSLAFVQLLDVSVKVQLDTPPIVLVLALNFDQRWWKCCDSSFGCAWIWRRSSSSNQIQTWKRFSITTQCNLLFANVHIAGLNVVMLCPKMLYGFLSWSFFCDPSAALNQKVSFIYIVETRSLSDIKSD